MRRRPLIGRQRWIAAAALTCAVAVVFSAAGCHSKKSKQKQIAEKVAAVEGMAAIPASADVVAGADVAALARSPLVERAVGQMLASDPGLSTELDKLFSGCGINPARDVRSVLVAMDTAGGATSNRALLVASGTLSENQIASCVGRRMSALGGKLVQQPLNGRTEYHADAPPGRTDVWFAFGSKDVVVVSSSEDFLTEALGKGARLSDVPELAALVDRARTEGAALWAAGKVAPEVGKGLQSATGGSVGPPAAMFGHVTLTAGLEAQLGVVVSSPDEANKAVLLAKQQLAIVSQLAQKWDLGRLVAKIRVSAKDDTLLLDLALDEQDLRAALAPIDSAPDADQTTTPLTSPKSPGNTGKSKSGAPDRATPPTHAPQPSPAQSESKE